MAFVYVLRCADGSFYIGSTSDLAARIARHDSGTACAFTASRRPVTLVFHEVFATMEEAFRRERQLKGWRRAKKEALIAGEWVSLKQL